MSNNTQTMQLDPLLSSSIERKVNGQGSNLFNSVGRKSSFDFVNVFEKSDRFDCKLKNSLQLLSSNAVFSNKPQVQTKDLLKYNEEEKNRFEINGIKNAIEIGEVVSDSEEEHQINNPSQNVQNSSHVVSHQTQTQVNLETYKLNNYLPPELEEILRIKEIPLTYVRGLLLVKDAADGKSARRLKVERYLEKRRKKTWNRKICYNCRQKVAQERLRIKGKFIKKRRAMQLLGLPKPVPLAELKRLLEQKLHDKTHTEIEALIRQT